MSRRKLGWIIYWSVVILYGILAIYYFNLPSIINSLVSLFLGCIGYLYKKSELFL